MDAAAAFAAALQFEADRAAGACEEVVEHPLGRGYRHLGVPRAHLLNDFHVRPGIDVGAEALAAAADEVHGDLLHRKVVVEDDALGARLAEGFATLPGGWVAGRTLYLALDRPEDRPPAPGLARRVDEATMKAVEAAATREEPFGSDAELLAQLGRAKSLAARGAGHEPRFYVGTVDGVDACHATLMLGDGIAQVEEVATLTEHRRRGLARAVVSLARDEGRALAPLVFIVADADDWPKELYRKLGFSEVGRRWSFTRFGPEHPAHAIP